MSLLYARCKNCNGVVWGNTPHTCLPEWLVSIPLYDYSASVFAESDQRAAEIAVERFDYEGADFICVQGTDLEVTVQNAWGEAIEFSVSGESVPQYTAAVVVV